MSLRANVNLKKEPCNELKKLNIIIIIIYLDFENLQSYRSTMLNF